MIMLKIICCCSAIKILFLFVFPKSGNPYNSFYFNQSGDNTLFRNDFNHPENHPNYML